MDIVDSIVAHFKKAESKTYNNAPEGLCPVCWGYQEYDHKIRTLIRDKQLDINNHKDTYMIIQEFVSTNIDGIALKVGEIKICPTCGNENNKHHEHPDQAS